MKGDYRGYGDDSDRILDDKYLRTRARRTSRGKYFSKIEEYFLKRILFFLYNISII
jgi:hypothetical protein